MIALAVLVLEAVPADAAKLRTVARSGVSAGLPTGPGVTTTVVARCPKGTKAVSGGFTTSVPRFPGRWFVVSESMMTSKGDGWRVSGAEHDPFPAVSEFWAYAYCEKRKRSILVGSTTRTGFTPGVAGQTTGNSATCPKGTTAISGGFKTRSISAYFNRSQGSGRNWSVEVTNAGPAPVDSYDVQAYCVRGKVRRVDASGIVPGSPPEGVATTATPGCGKKRFVRGGGYGAFPPAAFQVRGPVVFGDILNPTGWKVSAVSIDGTQDAYTAFGYCRPD